MTEKVIISIIIVIIRRGGCLIRKLIKDPALKFFLVILLGGVLHHFETTHIGALDTLIFCLNFVVYSGLIIFWYHSLKQRLLPSDSRRYMLWSAVLMVFFLLVRCVKYRIIPAGSELAVSRYCWYSYYIPLLFVPSFFLLVGLNIKNQGSENGSIKKLLLFVSALLSGIVLTNDFHHLVFAPLADSPQLFSSAYRTYSYGALYYICVAYSVLCAVVALGILIHSMSKKNGIKKALTPLLILLVMAVVIIAEPFIEALMMRVMFKMPEACIFAMLGIYESCVRYRLIPYNENYAGFFNNMKFPAVITNEHFSPVYTTAVPVVETPLQFEAAQDTAIYPTEDMRLSGKSLKNGFVFWSEDISELNRMNDRLISANELLASENQLIEAENELKAQRQKVDSRNRIYAEVTDKMYPAQRRIGNILEAAEPCTEGFKTSVARMCVLNAYVKRGTNMLLISEENESAAINELYLAICESAKYLELCGVSMSVKPFPQGEIKCKTAFDFYSGFELIAEALIDNAQTACTEFSGAELRVTASCGEIPEIETDGLPLLVERSGGQLIFTVKAKGGADYDTF